MRIISLILSVLLLFALVACGETETTSDPESSTASVAESTVESVAESTVESTVESSVESTEESTEASEEASTEESTEASEEASTETSEEVSEEDEIVVYAPLEIKKASTAPIVDGVVSSKEYATKFEFDASKAHWNVASTEKADTYDVVLYMSWDEEYLYTAISLRVGMQRTYDNTDFLQNRPYIFDRRHVMSAIVAGNPTDPKYLPPEGTEWDWSAAYNSGLGTEWTITAQPDGTNIKADHFGSLTNNPNFQYIVAVSKNETEVYEQRIPWAALAGGANFTAEDGAIFGYAFSACCEEVDITESEGDEDAGETYACFGDGIINGKNFAKYVGITLTDK